VAVCVEVVGAGDVQGMFDTASGALDLTIPIRFRTLFGTSLDQPCPACLTADGQPTIGEFGNCAGGPSSGAPCRVGGVDPRLGAGGGTSSDCSATPEGLIGDSPLVLRLSTGAVTLAPTTVSPRCRGFINETCMCDTCNNAAANPCTTNADCPASGGVPGVCGGSRCLGGPNVGLPCSNNGGCPLSVCNRPGEPPRRNACGDGICTPVPAGDGVCLESSPVRYCADAPWRSCNDNHDCPYGLCVLGDLPRCFPDAIVRSGVAAAPTTGHAEPTLVGGLCFPPTAGTAVNGVFGLPGPGVLTLPVTVDFQR
jgi:hypothetical protein